MMRNILLFILLSSLSLTVMAIHPAGKEAVSYVPSGLLTPLYSKSNLKIDTAFNLGIRKVILKESDSGQIQLGAFMVKSNAESFLEKVRKYVDKNAVMINEDSLYKVRIFRLTSTREISHSDTVSLIPVSLRSTDIKDEVKSIASRVFFLKEDSTWLRRIKYFGKSVAFVNALIVTIVFSIASMIILLIVILLNRKRMENEEQLHQYLLEKYQGLIIDYLFGNAIPDDFRKIASDNYRRQVLIDQMIDVSVNLKGEEANKLVGLYKHLDLDRDSIRRAKDYRWHKKIKGFRELAFMNIKEANDTIYKALNSSNELLRMEAQIALVRLGDSNPFEFLTHLNRPFSLWEQITLHDLIIQQNIAVPAFNYWLTSGNPTVVMFSLRMIREFKQNEAEDDVRKVFAHNNQEVRKLAVEVAGDMQMRSTLETMKHMYKNQEYSVCLEIIRSMGKMPDVSMIGFLKLVLDKEDDVQLQIEAVKAIENNGTVGVETLVKLMKSEYKNYNIIVRHVLDRRIF